MSEDAVSGSAASLSWDTAIREPGYYLVCAPSTSHREQALPSPNTSIVYSRYNALFSESGAPLFCQLLASAFRWLQHTQPQGSRTTDYYNTT